MQELLGRGVVGVWEHSLGVRRSTTAKVSAMCWWVSSGDHRGAVLLRVMAAALARGVTVRSKTVGAAVCYSGSGRFELGRKSSGAAVRCSEEMAARFRLTDELISVKLPEILSTGFRLARTLLLEIGSVTNRPCVGHVLLDACMVTGARS
jgi:hypothetical protein